MRMLALEEFPQGRQNNAFLRDGIIRICSASRIRLELTVTKRTESEQLYLLLFLRWSGISRKELERRMEQDSEILRKQFKSAGILSSFVEDTEKGRLFYLPMIRHFTEKEDGIPQKFSQAFFPVEPDTGTGGPYLPGKWSWDENGWYEIASVLARHEAFLFSLQMIPTILFPAEKKEIGIMLRQLSGRETGIDAEKTRYGQLCLAKDQPMYRVNLWISGGPNLIREAGLFLRDKGLSSLTMPPLLFNESGYPMSGDQKLSDYLNRCAHRKGFSKGLLPSACQRLNSLIAETELQGNFTLPEYWQNIAGLRIHGVESEPVLLPEKLQEGNDRIFIGNQEKTGREVYIPVSDITFHGCIVGKPGSGKTTFALGFLDRLYKHEPSIPFLVFEPAKKEYRTLMQCIPDLRVYTPGASDISPLQMNLFLPPPGVTKEEYFSCVEEIFDMSFSMTSLLKDIFTKVIRDCYDRYDWRDDSTRDSEGVRPFGLHEFIREFRRYIRENIYDPESRNNVENSGVLRLQKLLEQDYIMFDTIRAPDYLKMLSEPTVIELDAISDPTQRSLVMAIIIVNLMALIRKRTADFSGKTKNVILIDEAHVILNPESRVRDADGADPGGAALRKLQHMTTILRGYGTALFFGDQSPSRLTKDILKNVNLKMMFRMDDPEDRSILAQTALLNQSMVEEMITLNPGQGFLSCKYTSIPVLVQTPDTERQLNLTKNVSDEAVAERMGSELQAPFPECERCESCAGGCRISIRKEARHLAKSVIGKSRRISELLPADPAKARASQAGLPAYLKEEFYQEAQTIGRPRLPWTDQLAACARIQMIRELLIHGSCDLSEEELTGEMPVEKRPADGNQRKKLSADQMLYRNKDLGGT